ncbi:MAG: hypothetical protein E6J90_16745 [Deltaproteobacteria bacterium]|nr:MAG: hypothetical protein E6J91_19690 [Deltaproteobacteria bacterium]TMQ20146.1 MAG: hypothetical protein E6J90_16745 [Deltaproteobacteria bacterium]
MALELVTTPDERQRCMVVEDGERCPRTTAARISPANIDEHEQELYAYTCRQHLEAVLAELGPAYVATELSR